MPGFLFGMFFLMSAWDCSFWLVLMVEPSTSANRMVRFEGIFFVETLLFFVQRYVAYELA